MTKLLSRIHIAWFSLFLVLAFPGFTRGGDLPGSVSLRQQFVEHGLVVEQQARDNCWAFSVAGVLDYEYAVNAGQGVRLSAGFLTWAGQATDFRGARGSNFGRAWRGLERYGICRLDLFPARDSSGRDARPAADVLADARLRLGVQARWIKFIETPRGLNDEQFQAIKADLATGHPVAVGMLWPVRESFDPRQPDLMIDPGPGGARDGHCVVVIGYRDDPALAGGGAFLFRNSWGARWKDHGYARMTYALARRCIGDAVGFRVGARRDPEGFAEPVAAAKMRFEAEELPVVRPLGASSSRQSMLGFPGGKWSGNRQLFGHCEGTSGGLGLELSLNQPGGYWLAAAPTRAPDFGRIRFELDGANVGEAVECCGPDVAPLGRVVLGRVKLAAGKHILRVLSAGKCPAAAGVNFGLDAIELLAIQIQ